MTPVTNIQQFSTSVFPTDSLKPAAEGLTALLQSRHKILNHFHSPPNILIILFSYPIRLLNGRFSSFPTKLLYGSPVTPVPVTPISQCSSPDFTVLTTLSNTQAKSCKSLVTASSASIYTGTACSELSVQALYGNIPAACKT
jgi:hypothetical protein